MFWVLICTVQLTVCSYHVTYAFQSQSTIYFCLNLKDLFAQSRHVMSRLSDWNWTWTQDHLVDKLTLNHLAKLTKWRAVFWVLFCKVQLNGCSYHVTNSFQSEFILYSFQNVQELLARSRREMWSLSDCHWTQTQNHVSPKPTLNCLAKLTKWLSCVLSTYL